jgi:prolyl oligopeptidase
VTMVGVPDQLQKIIGSEGDQSPFFEPFKDLDNFNDDQKSVFRQRAQNIITAELVPAYEKSLAFIVEKYIPQCRTEIGIFNLPGGKEKYLSQIQYYTTTYMTAEEIHDLGLLEVKRIKDEMETIKKQTGFKGSLSAFNQFLRTDSQFFHKTREELIADYRDICKRIDPELIKLFGILPRLPYGVIPVPEYLEKYYTTARYQGGSMENGKPGYFLANTYDLQSYKDDYSKYGQLTYEMWRAIRLVVDTGIHSFGWSRKEAITYFMDNSAKTRKDIEVEIDRYIAWPGQALAYKIGELKIKELKLIAGEALGDRFDIREFHDMLLSKGSLPLYVLEQNVEDWIKEQAGS